MNELMKSLYKLLTISNAILNVLSMTSVGELLGNLHGDISDLPTFGRRKKVSGIRIIAVLNRDFC